LHSFSAAALRGVQWSASHPGFTTPGEGMGVWMGPVARPDAVTREKNLIFSGNRTTIVGYPVRSFVITSYAMQASKARKTLTIIIDSTL